MKPITIPIKVEFQPPILKEETALSLWKGLAAMQERSDQEEKLYEMLTERFIVLSSVTGIISTAH